MKHIFIINKFSANKKLDKISEKIKTACEELKIDYLIEYNSENSSIEDILKRYQETEYAILGGRRRWDR